MKTLYSLAQLYRKSEELRTWLLLRVSEAFVGEKKERSQKRFTDSILSTIGTETPNSPTHEAVSEAKIALSSTPSPTDRLKQHQLYRLLSKYGGGQKHQRRQGKERTPVMWVIAVVSLTSVMGNRFYNQPKLDVGKAAPQTIKAPFNASVEDTKTTEDKRKEALTGSFPVLRIDKSITQDIEENLHHSLGKMEELRKLSGSFPFIQNTILSDSTQQYLRQIQEWEWQAIIAFSNNNTQSNSFDGTQNSESLNVSFIQAVQELENYRHNSSTKAFSDLINAIASSRQNYNRALRELSESAATESYHHYDSSFLNLSDPQWQQTKIGITQASDRILAQGIPPGLPSDILQEAVKVQISSLVPIEAQPVVIQIFTNILQPNLRENKEQTKRRAEQAAQAVKPVMVSIAQGEVIVKAGEEITQADFVLLDYFGLSHREINWTALLGFGTLVSGAVTIVWLVERQCHPRLRRRDHILLLLLSLTTPLLSTFGVLYTDLPAIGLLVGSFYGSSLGLTVVTLLTGLVEFSMEVSWEYLLASAAGSIVGAMMAGRMRSREELAVLGGVVGLTQGSVNLLLNLISSASAGSVWYAVLPGATVYGLAAWAWSVVALGLSPYLERLFDLVTPIRLAELSNPNRTLLKRLATEAPGTFQHTLFVASLAEAAARELHCNVELVRAGTLYHDIGKMHDPLGFIENQMGDPNKHDEINDPWRSAEIIKKHVSEGLVIARKHQLPKAIRDFIPEHQGTILIAFFYFQAQQKAQNEGESPVNESDFRYDGPIPQSRETGIVMLADACEAALRSLKDVTPEMVLGTVNKIFKSRWQDNQLVDCGLTREDLSTIARVFVRVWQQYNHQRIAYPQGALK
ncbi:HD family phosphohydrolase [Limnofasciculus baicalensis]|uniref:HD family phosphohydrolase n=1 Tax=Limnofasciculus baicalensis BBK-W-15 TaxID=2699891 RepID=A0AAE3KSW8_9CYAN|nr:HD family phosphohydrolase [Limnofasciculus baicalensis]MCP2729902.1 HD family phosphohydrolase [Limnofasciculus baicalensis BBK-W-15]